MTAIVEWATIIIFMVILCTPAIGMITTPYAKRSQAERRFLAEFPEWQEHKALVTYTKAIGTFVDDHFGLREELLEIGSNLNFRIFNEAITDMVQVGRDGWLFYNADHTIDNYRGISKPLTQQQLEQFELALEARIAELAEQGIAYYLVIAPDKQTIYGQYFPEKYGAINTNTYQDQIIKYFHNHPTIHIIDLRPALLEASQSNPDQDYYYPVDTHWNYYGAFVGYSEIMSRISEDFPDIFYLKELPLNQNQTSPNHDGLVRMARLDIPIGSEFPLSEPTSCITSVYAQHENRDINHYQCDDISPALKVLLFHDSFGQWLGPLLQHSSFELTTVWDTFQQDIYDDVVADFGVDIVIEEWVERNIPNKIKMQ